ncbi:mannonate dehydratase [Haloarcula marina]|uniref:mannonate dehydratase n=1 Tax=Haloarcula marina TaxID=2961574 RepID=UPI0020B7A744|nr:mannonate dehydratase [Halomicroarcula marina]
MDSTVMLPHQPDERWTIARQLGIETAVVRFFGTDEWWDFDTLLKTRNRFENHGFSLDVIEDRPPMQKTVLGEEGRDEEIEAVKTLLRNMGKLGIGTYCWVWTENPLGVLRTSESIPLRGDSRTTGYEHADQQRADDYPVDITEAELWENLQYFLDEVVPVAEAADVNMALHPDDPPVSPIRGVPRIVSSIENYERILDMYDSPNHGLTFCQGNFSAMEADIPAAIERFGDKIHFVHFRDVEGGADSFFETWHDEGPTNMKAAIEAYQDVGFDGPIRPDHVPKMLRGTNRDEATPENVQIGRLFAIGYIKGLLE